MISFIGAMSDNEALSAQLDELKQDLTTAIIMLAQEAANKVVGELGTQGATGEGVGRIEAVSTPTQEISMGTAQEAQPGAKSISNGTKQGEAQEPMRSIEPQPRVESILADAEQEAA